MLSTLPTIKTEACSLDVLTAETPHVLCVGDKSLGIGLLLSLLRSREGGSAVIISGQRPSGAMQLPVLPLQDVACEVGARHHREGLALLREAIAADQPSTAVLRLVDDICREVEELYDQRIQRGRIIHCRFPLERPEAVLHVWHLLQREAIAEDLRAPLVEHRDGRRLSIGEAQQILSTADDWRQQLTGIIDVHVLHTEAGESLSADGLEPLVEDAWLNAMSTSISVELRREARFANADLAALRELADDLAQDRRWEAAWLYGPRRQKELSDFTVSTVVSALEARAEMVAGRDGELAAGLRRQAARIDALTAGDLAWEPWSRAGHIEVLRVPRCHDEARAGTDLGSGRLALFLRFLVDRSADPEQLDRLKTIVVDADDLHHAAEIDALVRACRIGRKSNCHVVIVTRNPVVAARYAHHVGHAHALQLSTLAPECDADALPASAGGYLLALEAASLQCLQAWFSATDLERAMGQWEPEGTLL